MKKTLVGMMCLTAIWNPLNSWAVSTPSPASSGVFSSLTGQVTVQDQKGKKRTAQKNSKAFEGETVKVDHGGKATLLLFDGSTLDLKPDSEVVLKTLQKPAKNEKKLKFSILFGGLLAKVQKLLTAKSSFEVEAGGVVCGVRGTQFEMSYDPKSNQVHLHVLEGSVFTNFNGENNLFKAGDQMQFLNGLLQNPQGPSQNPGANNLNSQNPNSGSNQSMAGFDSPMSGGQDSTAAVGDLNGQFEAASGVNSDNTFSDPSVGGTSHITVHVVVPAQETHP